MYPTVPCYTIRYVGGYLSCVSPSSGGGFDGIEDGHEHVRVVVRSLALKNNNPNNRKNPSEGRQTEQMG